MTRPRFFLMLGCLLALIGLTPRQSLAVRAQPLVCRWAVRYSGPGVYGDGLTNNGDANYDDSNSKRGVRCYFGVNGKDLDMVTYDTGRKLHLVFPAGQGIPLSDGSTMDDLVAEFDLFGINYYGPFRTMGVGTTALLQVDLEFHFPDGPNPLTYELEYRALAVERISEGAWVVTSNPIEICGAEVCTGLGFTPSPLANLNTVRRKSIETIRENVFMPIRFVVKLQQ